MLTVYNVQAMHVQNGHPECNIRSLVVLFGNDTAALIPILRYPTEIKVNYPIAYDIFIYHSPIWTLSALG